MNPSRKKTVLKSNLKRKDYIRDFRLKQDFGITLEEYNMMFDLQKGVCGICGKEEQRVNPWTNRPRNLAVDHNHETGKIRGLLCAACNTGIGLLGDSSEILNKAINYLKQGEK